MTTAAAVGNVGAVEKFFPESSSKGLQGGLLVGKLLNDPRNPFCRYDPKGREWDAFKRVTDFVE